MKTYPCNRCNTDEGSPVCLQDERCPRDGAERSVEAREPRPAMILRLLAEAQAGVRCEVSMVDALDFRREQYGLTWAEFGMLLGLSAQHMSEVKNGKRRLPIGALKRAYAIGVPADALLQHLTANVRAEPPTPAPQR